MRIRIHQGEEDETCLTKPPHSAYAKKTLKRFLYEQHQKLKSTGVPQQPADEYTGLVNVGRASASDVDMVAGRLLTTCVSRRWPTIVVSIDLWFQRAQRPAADPLLREQRELDHPLRDERDMGGCQKFMAPFWVP